MHGLPDVSPGGAHDASAISYLQTLGPHQDILRTLIHEAKYGGHASIAKELGRRLRAQCGTALAGADAVVPVPLHPFRRLQRGYNQADILARELGLPVLRVLRRRRWTRSQTQLPADGRRANVEDAFTLAWKPWKPAGRLLRDRVLVLVDDVRTTGATLEACAEVLRAAGAAEVRAVVAARAELTPERTPARR